MGEAQQITDRGNAAHQGRKTIVIADDDRTVRNVLARVLEISGYETVPVESGEACLTEVNLSARLCGSAAPMSAVVSATVVQRCGSTPGLRFTAPTQISVRGVKEPVAIYQLENAPTVDR